MDSFRFSEAGMQNTRVNFYPLRSLTSLKLFKFRVRKNYNLFGSGYVCNIQLLTSRNAFLHLGNEGERCTYKKMYPETAHNVSKNCQVLQSRGRPRGLDLSYGKTQTFFYRMGEGKDCFAAKIVVKVHTEGFEYRRLEVNQEL